jgi:hypothetical protein
VPVVETKIEDSERQVILLGLAELALSRPGWTERLEDIAERFDGLELFDQFKRANSDRVRESHAPPGESWPERHANPVHSA